MNPDDTIPHLADYYHELAPPYPKPSPDADVAAVIDHALARLAALRRLSNPAHGPTQLHLLATLIAEAEQRLPDALTLTHDQDLDWTDIARPAGLTLHETILLADPDPEHDLDN